MAQLFEHLPKIQWEIVMKLVFTVVEFFYHGILYWCTKSWEEKSDKKENSREGKATVKI